MERQREKCRKKDGLKNKDKKRMQLNESLNKNEKEK